MSFVALHFNFKTFQTQNRPLMRILKLNCISNAFVNPIQGKYSTILCCMKPNHKLHNLQQNLMDFLTSYLLPTHFYSYLPLYNMHTLRSAVQLQQRFCKATTPTANNNKIVWALKIKEQHDKE